jgi:hypothetical protein
MASRLNLHEEFCDILRSRNVYFQPPASLKMNYPCIRYSLAGVDSKRADDIYYKSMRRYEVTLIDTNPDSEFFDPILDRFSMCSFDRGYTADNLNHFVFTIYY